MQLGLQGIIGRDYKNYALYHFEESKEVNGPAADSGSSATNESKNGGVMGVAVSVGSIKTL